MRTTLDDVARIAGVSRTTASRVLNGRGDVRAEVRERVETVIRDTKFRPLASARSLVSQRSLMIGLVLPLGVRTIFENPFMAEVLTDIGRVSEQRGLSTALFLLDDQAHDDSLIEGVVGPRRVDGLILASHHERSSLLDRLVDLDVPVVLLGANRYQHRFASVVVDERLGGRIAARHLLDAGYRRIGVVTGPESHPAPERIEGFADELARGGAPLDPRLVAHGDYTADTAELVGRQLLEARPEAVFAASDMTALGVLRAARALGLEAPGDFGLIGFDDIRAARTTSPPLTTVRQPTDLQAVAALDALAAQERDPASREHHVLAPELVVRASTARR